MNDKGRMKGCRRSCCCSDSTLSLEEQQVFFHCYHVLTVCFFIRLKCSKAYHLDPSFHDGLKFLAEFGG